MATKFKVGDRVRYIGTGHDIDWRGRIKSIYYPQINYERYVVSWDNGMTASGYTPEKLETDINDPPDILQNLQRFFSNREIIDAAIAEITRLRAIVAKAKAAGLADANGNPKKVLGKLPLTDDDCIIGLGANVYSGLMDGTPCFALHPTTLWVNNGHDHNGTAFTPVMGVVPGARPGVGWFSNYDAAQEANRKHRKILDRQYYAGQAWSYEASGEARKEG